MTPGATSHERALIGVTHVAFAVLGFVLRKPRALAKSAILRRIAARARSPGREALDATAASSAPVAISVDVDHDS